MKKFIKVILLTILYQHKVFAGADYKIAVNPAKLGIAEFYQKYTAVGQVKLSNSKDYFAKVSGRVDFVLASQGTALNKDDILITIDGDIADRLKSQTEASLYLAESNYNRDTLLIKKKITSEEGINTSKAALEKAKKDYADTLKTYDHMVIKAPENGYVGVVKARIGDEIKVGDYLFSFTTKSNFYIFVELPESMQGNVLTTDKVIIKNKRGNIIEGKILAISDYISNSGTITAKLEFPYDDDIFHGSFIETEIIFNKHQALALPEKAVLKNNQGNFVYLITPENTVKQVFIKLGIRTGDMIELLSNELKEGDMIVVDGLTKVHDGAEVIVKNDEAKAKD